MWVIVLDAFCLLKRLGKREGALFVGGFVLGSSWNLIGLFDFFIQGGSELGFLFQGERLRWVCDVLLFISFFLLNYMMVFGSIWSFSCNFFPPLCPYYVWF